ncbi:MAG: flagellin [Clostridiaceae bacterium]
MLRNTNNGAKFYIYDDRPSHANEDWPDNGMGVFELNVYGEIEEKEDQFLHLDMQVGSDAGESFRIKVPNVTVEQLDIDDLSVDPQENATSAITKLDDAISRVTEARTTIGSYQNALELIGNNVVNYAYNITSAESRISDADMAKEVMEMTKSSIIEQSAQSILKQAEKMPESVINLMNKWQGNTQQ